MSFLMKKCVIIKLVIYVSLFLITVQDYTNMLVYNIIPSPFFVISTSSLSYQYLRHKWNFFSLSFVIYFYSHLDILFDYVVPFSALQIREKRKTRKYISIQPRHHKTITPRRDEKTLKNVTSAFLHFISVSLIISLARFGEITFPELVLYSVFVLLLLLIFFLSCWPFLTIPQWAFKLCL